MRRNQRFPGESQGDDRLRPDGVGEAGHASCQCETAEEALNLYVDGELPIEEQSALFVHLTTCSRCRMLLESVLQFRRVSRLERVAVSPALDEAFLKRLAHHKAGHEPVERVHHTWTLQRPVMTAVCMALLFMAGMWMNGDEPSPPSQSPATHHETVEHAESSETTSAPAREALYVFYPGLTVEAQRVEEPTSPDAL